MKYYHFGFICIFLLTSCKTTDEREIKTSHAETSRYDGLLTQLLDGQSLNVDVKNLPVAFKEIFSKTSETDLIGLTKHSDNTVACQSAWMLHQINPQKHDANWFLTFLERRTMNSPPSWWVRRGFGIGPSFEEKSHLTEVSIGWPRSAQITKRSKSQYIYSVGSNSIVLPENCFDPAIDTVSGYFTDDRFYFASVDVHGFNYGVMCIDRKSNRIVWESIGIGCQWGLAMGPASSDISITESPNGQIWVHGDSSGFFCSAFDKTDGSDQFHFSSRLVGMSDNKASEPTR